jgi:hypothetical protein
MDSRAPLKVLALTLATCLALSQAPAWAAAASGKWVGKTYKWVDENGVTHYSDSVPTEAAQQSRSELNKQGVEINQVARQLSGTEAEQAQMAAAEKSRIRQHDSFLMTTYTSAKDIEQLRDERLSLITGQIDIARGSIESTNQRLAGLETRMRSFKPWSTSATARRLPDQLVQEVVRSLQDRNSLLAALASREKERDEMRTKFEADLTRYREITQGPRPAPGSVNADGTLPYGVGPPVNNP